MSAENFPDDFEKVDIEVEATHPVIVKKEDSFDPSLPPTDMMEQRKHLVREYHNGAENLPNRLEVEGKNNMESMVMALVNEIILETDTLLGNELIATKANNLRDASIIAFKRSEVLEKAIKAIQTKQIFDQDNGIDVDSPAMRVVFRFFMDKVKSVFTSMGYGDEASDTFFRNLLMVMEDWKKELKGELDEINTLSTGKKKYAR